MVPQAPRRHARSKGHAPGRVRAGHIVNVQVSGTATHRLLDPTYDIKTAFGGRHADKADVLDKVRELMRDSPPRAHSKGFTWKEDEFQKLSPQGQRDFRAVLHDEMRLNLTPKQSP